MRELIPLPRHLLRFLVTVAIAAVVGTIGPFGTYTALSPVNRYAYWFAIIFLNWFQIVALVYAVSHARFAARWPDQAIVALACAGAAVPATFEVLWLENYFRPNPHKPGPLELYGYVLMLSLAIAVPLARYFMWLRAAKALALRPPRPPRPSSPRLSFGASRAGWGAISSACRRRITICASTPSRAAT